MPDIEYWISTIINLSLNFLMPLVVIVSYYKDMSTVLHVSLWVLVVYMMIASIIRQLLYEESKRRGKP